MNLVTYQWNGFSINDWYWNGTGIGEWSSEFPVGQRANLAGTAVYSPIAYSFPKLSTVQINDHYITILFHPKSKTTSLAALREQLKQWLQIGKDFTQHQLVARDIEDANRQWYVNAIPVNLTQNDIGEYAVTFALVDPIWRVVTASTSGNVTVTSSPTNYVATIKGNVPAQPILQITPVSGRTGAYLYFRYVKIFNKVASLPFPANYSSVDVTFGGFDTTGLVSNTAVSNQINQIGGIGAADLTITIGTPVGGGLPVSGGMCYVDTEQILYDSITGGGTTMNVNANGRGYGGTTAATHANAAVMTQSKTQADGTDVRVMVDGTERYKWFGTGTHAWNQVATQIWSQIPHSGGQIGHLATALPNSGTAVDVVFTKNDINMLKAIAAAPNSVFIIDSEIFTFQKQNVDFVNLKIKSCSRAQKTTSFAAHSVNALITWIQHDVWLVYGNATGTAQVVDDTRKPMIDLGSSTNSSWVFTNFFDSANPARPASWRPSIIQSVINSLVKHILSYYYTGNQGASATPSTELGLQMQTAIVSNVVKAETANELWTFYHPAGIQTVSMLGSKYMYDLSSWPTIAGLQYSSNAIVWYTAWNEAKPTLAQTWQTFTHNAVSLGGAYLYVGLRLQGSIAAKVNNIAYLQGDTVTLALGTNILQGALLAENSNYQITATVTNQTSGESITINASLALGQSITIDFGAKTCVRSDGANLFNAITLSSGRVNADWLNIGQDTNQKFVGTATLVYTEPGVVDETIVYTWSDSAE